MKDQMKKNSGPLKHPRTPRQVDDEACRIISSLSGQLSEHFASVQIVGTILDPNGRTRRFSWGAGDLAARFKAAEMFLCDAERQLM
jgi:hypothetical protein